MDVMRFCDKIKFIDKYITPPKVRTNGRKGKIGERGKRAKEAIRAQCEAARQKKAKRK